MNSFLDQLSAACRDKWDSLKVDNEITLIFSKFPGLKLREYIYMAINSSLDRAMYTGWYP